MSTDAAPASAGAGGVLGWRCPVLYAVPCTARGARGSHGAAQGDQLLLLGAGKRVLWGFWVKRNV